MVKKICTLCLLEYNTNSEDQKVCFPCYKKINNMREIEDNEIVIDIDNREEHGCRCVSSVGIALFNDGYNFTMWYAEGQKQPHIHIKNIPHIAELTDEQIKEYKILFLKKYISQEFWNEKIPDYTVCVKNHLIAEENKLHFKYKTLKLLRSEFNQNKENFCDLEIYNKVKEINEDYNPKIKGSGITAKLIQLIDIREIARQFGLILHGNKTLCPFHADSKTESLVFYEKQGRFHCFGCNEDGNLIKFYALLKRINPNFRYKKEIITRGQGTA